MFPVGAIGTGSAKFASRRPTCRLLALTYFLPRMPELAVPLAA